MKKIVHKSAQISLVIISALLQSSVFLVSAVILISLSYILTWTYINANGPIGTDATSAFAYTKWINDFFPDIPFWYPLQGAGVSFIAGYPNFAHYLSTVVHQITGLTLIRSFNMLEALAFPVAAVSIVLYCWARLEYPKQKISRIIIGFIAALIFLVSPITYIWTYRWGFYAESVSYLFIGPALICIDWYLDLAFKKESSFKKRLALIGALLFYLAAGNTHFGAFLGLTHLTLALIIMKTISGYKTEGKAIFRTTLIVSAGLFIPLAALFLPRFMLYKNYAAQAALGGFAGYDTGNTIISEKSIATYNQLLGLEPIKSATDPRVTLNDYAMPIYVWIFATIALCFGWIRSKKIATFSVLGVYGFFNFTNLALMQFIYKTGFLLWIMDPRFVWTVYRFTIPIAAAFGIFILWDLLLSLPELILKRIPLLIKAWSNIIKPAAVLACGIIGFISIVCYFEKPFFNQSSTKEIWPYKKIGPKLINVKNIWSTQAAPNSIESADLKNAGVEHSEEYDALALFKFCSQKVLLNTSGENIQEICNQLTLKDLSKPLDLTNLNELSTEKIKQAKQYCSSLTRSEYKDTNAWCEAIYIPYSAQLNPYHWPKIENTKQPYVTEEDINTFHFLYGKDPVLTRFDQTGSNGSIIMKSPLITNISQIQTYIGQLNLFSALWNYQSSVMYATQPAYQKKGILTELAQWFGLEYIMAGSNGSTPTYLYKEDENWEEIEQGGLWRFKNPTTLVTWTTKPALLFIGDEKHYFYDQAFKVFNVGGLLYTDAITFNGREAVDSYSYEELKNFDAVFLKGYKYTNRNKAHGVLDKYVAGGGGIFIDTGWQFYSPDWQGKGFIPFFPTNELVWKSIGSRAQMKLDSPQAIEYSHSSPALGYLTLDGGNWGISTPKDIRENTEVVLQVDNAPILTAGKYKKGRVIWSGFNMIAHIEGGKNENINEIKLLRQSLQWILKSASKQNEDLPVTVIRKNPDRVVFKLHKKTDATTTLYWRESFYPNWKAELIKNNTNKKIPLTVNMAGPRFMGIRVPRVEAGDAIILYFTPTLSERILSNIQYLAIIYLALHLIGVTKEFELAFKNNIKSKIKKGKNINLQTQSFKIHEDPNNVEHKKKS